MNATGYRILGFVVWRGARWYVKRTYGHYVPSRRTAVIAGAATTALIGLVAVGAAKHSSG
jgi:hypothetical protein